MRRLLVATAVVGSALLAADPVSAQTPPAASAPPAPPLFATTKVEGTDNVYVFRYQGHQSMFVVTSDGVIATDPIGLGRPQAVTTYIDEIKKVTSQPIKYVIYSHSHYDHITGGKPFKDLGARFIAHKNAKAQLERLQPPNIVLPDEVVDTQHTLTLGGTTLELLYVGRNHSDNSLVMRLPKEKIIFAVDFIPVQALFWRSMPDSWLDEWEASLKRVLAMDWDRLIPGHPGPGRPTRQQAGCREPAAIHDRSRGRGQKGRGRGQVLRYGDEGGEAAEVRVVGQLRHLAARQRRALLLPLSQRILKTQEPSRCCIPAWVADNRPITNSSRNAVDRRVVPSTSWPCPSRPSTSFQDAKRGCPRQARA